MDKVGQLINAIGINATANQFFLAAIAIRYHLTDMSAQPIPNLEVKRISADGSVGFPHVRVGHCQVPIKETRLTAGFLRLEERKNGVRVH